MGVKLGVAGAGAGAGAGAAALLFKWPPKIPFPLLKKRSASGHPKKQHINEHTS